MSPHANSTRRNAGIVVSLAVVTALNGAAAKAATIFSDNFSSSKIDTTPTAPTDTSTVYQLISTKTRSPSPSIASGHLKFGIAATTSGVIEAQARFPAVTLATASDSLDFTVTFTDTSGILTQSGLLGFGLYNSGGVDAISGGLNATATSSTSAHTTDGTVGWQGYVSQYANTGGTSRIMDREIQNVGTITDNAQDILTSGSPSSSYSFPSAVTIGSSAGTSALALTAATTYTEDMLLTLNGDSTLTITSNLYAGTSATGTALATITGITAAAPLTTTFDAMGIGWRATANTTATTIDVNSITINANVASVTTPEPASLGLLAVGGLALLARRRKA